MDGVVVLALLVLARRSAPAHLGEDAGRTQRSDAEPLGALAQRQGLVQRGDGELGGPGGAERSEVGRAVVEDLAHSGEPRIGLDGELDPEGALGEAAAPVVARPVLGDEAQLAHLGLQGGAAHDRVDAVGEPHHLGHPGAHLAGREVGAHPGAQVDALADVKHPALGVAEEVDAGVRRQGIGEVALAPLGRRDLRREGAQLLEAVHPEVAEPADQPVQDVGRGLCVGERPVARGHLCPEEPGQAGQLAVGRLVAGQDAAGQLGGVEVLVGRPGDAEARTPAAQEAEIERRVVSDEHRALAEGEERRQCLVEAGGAGHHRVGDAGEHGDERRDRTARVDQGLELPEDLTAADLDRADLGDVAGQVRPTGGLEVDDDEGHLAQRPPQLVEGRLVRDRERAGHEPDGRGNL